MFHVEISAGFHRARSFNVSREELLATVVQPWLAGRTIELGDREWDPGESSLRILEGRPMENADLSFGQGWANAERACDNVTRRLLAETPPPREPAAFAIEAEDPEALAAAIAAEHGGHAVRWQDADASLGSRDPEPAAVIFLGRPAR